MGYLHIDNLYKRQDILAFKTCYALEKIHGTSAHIYWRNGAVGFFSGGEAHARFVTLFDADALALKFADKFTAADDVTVYGEAYGGKQQQMSATYGTDLKFVAFDVKIGESWLDVPNAVDVVAFLGLEFVDWAEVPTTLEAINAERDKPSVQSVRNGIIAEPKIREGIVLRPPYEVTLNNGHRLIAKHKREEFSERGRPALDDLDPTRKDQMEKADSVAWEWVTPMRLEHVIDRMIAARDNKEIEMRDTGAIIGLMVEDVTREAAGEIDDNEAARKAIGRRAAMLFKQRVQAITVAQ